MSGQVAMRYKVIEAGKMLVVSPDGDSEIRPVIVFYDQTNDAFGIVLKGESQLKGYLFEVPRPLFRQAMQNGVAMGEITVP